MIMKLTVFRNNTLQVKLDDRIYVKKGKVQLNSLNIFVKQYVSSVEKIIGHLNKFKIKKNKVKVNRLYFVYRVIGYQHILYKIFIRFITEHLRETL